MSQTIIKVLVYMHGILNLRPNYFTDAKQGQMEGKIVGGSYADIKDFPHAVYLYMSCGDMSMICGSSVVNQQILVTAAHCLRCQKSFKISAQAGNDNIKAVTVVRKAIKFVTHPGFSDVTLVNDIALILLSHKLPLGKNIKRIIIKKEYPEQASAYVAGWGITNDVTRSRSVYLKMVKVLLRPRNQCSVVGHLYSGMICAGTTQSTSDRPSRGDSGSALITTDHQQIGIVSFRTEPFIAMLVYTNVSYYYSWIQHTSKELYCSQKDHNLEFDMTPTSLNNVNK